MQSDYGLLFGFNVDNEDDVGYFAIVNNKSCVVSEENIAKHFPFKKARSQKGFGTPQQWCDLINEDPYLNHGYKFHVVTRTYS